MSVQHTSTTHRSWEDWLLLAVGGLIAVSPGFDGVVTAAHPFIIVNAVIVGLLVMVFAMSELAIVERWDEFANFACGAWLAASPFVFGYAGTGQLRVWHFVLGGAVAAMAMIELWQDRR